jgi:peptidoglycan/xylan/chitin deacetylase (PgdA/CDA1 family)
MHEIKSRKHNPVAEQKKMKSRKINVNVLASVMIAYALVSLASGMLSHNDVKAQVFTPGQEPPAAPPAAPPAPATKPAVPVVKAPTAVPIVNQTQSQNQSTAAKNPGFIIFRMDDLQDYFAGKGSIAAMNIFMKRGLPLLLGAEPDATGKDISLINKTKEGIKKGLFEIGLHGSKDYKKMTLQNQTNSIKTGIDKLFKIYAVHPTVFIPPMGGFNNDTLKALQTNHVPIISSLVFAEDEADTRDDIYNATSGCGDGHCNSPVHMSAVSQYRLLLKSGPKILNNTAIENSVANNIKNYGYAILLFHNQDFMRHNAKGKVGTSSAPGEVVQFEKLLDKLTKKYTPVNMHQLLAKTENKK